MLLEKARWYLLAAILLVAVPAHADEEQSEEEKGPWSGKAAMGYLATSGNTENSTLNAAFEVAYETGNWKHSFNAAAFNASEDEESTSESYEWAAKTERSFSEFDYLFGQLHWRKDRFSSYETQFSQTVGYGRRILNSDRHHLDAEIGGGARQSELADGTSVDEFVIRGAMKYTFAFSENAEFRQSVAVEAGDENTYLESISAVSASLIGNLALVASYTIKHNTDVLPGLEKTDTYTALSLEYLF